MAKAVKAPAKALPKPTLRPNINREGVVSGGVAAPGTPLGHGPQDGMFGQGVFAPTPVAFANRATTNIDGSPRFVTDPRMYALSTAQNQFLFEDDASAAQSLFENPEFNMTDEEYEQWFSEEALRRELERYLASAQGDPDSWSPFGDTFITDLMELSPLGEFEAFFGSPQMQPIDLIANPLLAFVDGDEQNEMMGIGRGLGRAALVAGLGGVLAPALGGAAGPLASTGVGMFTSGAADPRAAVTSAALSGGSELLAPYVNDALGMFAPPAGGDERLMLADAGTTATDASFDPAEYDWQADTSGNTTFATRMLEAAEAGGTAREQDDLDQADAENLATLEAGDELPTAEPTPTVTAEDLQRYARVAQTINSMLGAESTAAPTRNDGESAEDYSERLADYIGLDADVMAEQGLQPGTQEYYEYILAQADQIIAAQIGDDFDFSAEDLSAQLRTKTDAELQQLYRALYIRGQIDVLMGSGTYEDPVSGEGQEVISTGGMLNPMIAAFHRGLAGNVDTLAGMEGRDAYEYLMNLLGRDTDFFGMQRAADARRAAAEQEAARIDEEERRRRGMFGF